MDTDAGGGAARAPPAPARRAPAELAARIATPARRDPRDPRAAARGATPAGRRTTAPGCPHNVSHAAPAGRGRLGQPGLPLVRLDHRAARAAHRVDDAARRRGAAVDRARALHRPAAHGPERRRRLAVPLALPEHPLLRRGRGATSRSRSSTTGSSRTPAPRRWSAASPMPELTRMLELEGVRTIVVLTKDPDAYRGAELAGNARVEAGRAAGRGAAGAGGDARRHVLIYDGAVRQRAPAPAEARASCRRPNRFVVINEEVCEGCGHCGALTNCMSLHKVETELGAEDPDPHLLLQPGPLVPRRRLSLVRDGRDGGRDGLPAALAARAGGRRRPGARRAASGSSGPTTSTSPASAGPASSR